MARLAKAAETSICMVFLVVCTEKIRGLLILFFVTIFAWFYVLQKTGFFLMVLRDTLRIEREQLLVTA